MFPPMTPQTNPAPRYVNQPAPQPPSWPPQPQPQTSQAAAPSRPVFRGQAPEEAEPEPPPRSLAAARPAPLTLPAPEQLGLDRTGPASNAALDWAEVHRRLDRLGALSFHQQKLAAGGYRVTFLLPTDQPNRARQVEAEADSVAQAVTLALRQAEQWVSQKYPMHGR
jgi:hypothetical protein